MHPSPAVISMKSHSSVAITSTSLKYVLPLMYASFLPSTRKLCRHPPRSETRAAGSPGCVARPERRLGMGSKQRYRAAVVDFSGDEEFSRSLRNTLQRIPENDPADGVRQRRAQAKGDEATRS